MDQYQEKEAVELSVGQTLVGLSFNPSRNTKVDRVKELCAQLADIVYDDFKEDDKEHELPLIKSEILALIRNKALEDILTAQMTIVKALTFKL
jgi:hypothetical protein